MRVFRLCKQKYAEVLNGKGAAKSGNRWNTKGTEIIYTAESRALAMAEVAVHLTIASLPKNYVMMEIEVPENIAIKSISVTELNSNWTNHPPNVTTQKIGDNFIDSSAYCLLKVPSAVVQGDFNYLINPHHEDFKQIKVFEITRFPFDQRMFK